MSVWLDRKPSQAVQSLGPDLGPREASPHSLHRESWRTLVSSQPSGAGREPSGDAWEAQAEVSSPRASGPQEQQVLLQLPGTQAHGPL